MQKSHENRHKKKQRQRQRHASWPKNGQRKVNPGNQKQLQCDKKQMQTQNNYSETHQKLPTD